MKLFSFMNNMASVDMLKTIEAIKFFYMKPNNVNKKNNN